MFIYPVTAGIPQGFFSKRINPFSREGGQPEKIVENRSFQPFKIIFTDRSRAGLLRMEEYVS
jgi:hypothetical protein